jgi:sec-independent protein translocase protein TatB
MLSVPHMIVVFVIVLVVFGPQKLPELARGLGKLMAEFRKASTDFKSAFEEEMRDLERQARDVERKKQALMASAAAEQAQPATLANPSGAETQATPPELAAPTDETRASGAGELVATPVPESVARDAEAPEAGPNGAPHESASPTTPEAAAETQQLNPAHDHQQPA